MNSIPHLCDRRSVRSQLVVQVPIAFAAIIGCLLLSGSDLTLAQAQVASPRTTAAPNVPPNGPPNGPPVRWIFQVRSPVTVDSPIVYLRDLLRPLDPDLAAWDRLARAPIGLVPDNGTPMVIRRERLADAIRNGEATSIPIEIRGPKSIEVTYASSTPASQLSPSPNTGRAPASAAAKQPQVETRSSAIGAGVIQVSATAPTHSAPNRDSAPRLDSVTAKRLVYWIESAVAQHVPAIAERFEVAVPADQSQLANLADCRRLTGVRVSDPIAEGACRILVTGEAASGAVEVPIQLQLGRFPRAVSCRIDLRRGHRISAEDLTMVSVATSQWRDAYVVDQASLIGQEVVRPLRPGTPIERDFVRRPVLVKRGDLVEVRVIGGSITITTNAKALGEGGEMDLIQVETFDPKRKVIARVIEPGLVEVLSRATQVAP